MFKITEGKGFMIDLHGITVSVQFGDMNYCPNRSWDLEKSMAHRALPCGENKHECESAEVAVFTTDYRDRGEQRWHKRPKGDWITRGVWQNLFTVTIEDDVVGHVTPDEVAQVINYVNNLKGVYKGCLTETTMV